ncbi:DUF4139 domain-containing protein [Streptacidiphilus sp. PB12-B1b]|uniref:DUF4139 domain-containing protein n=1 Tax=Streptacidiphilus sp. PB12-B1b TaxID=2705012 RepID=UPI0015FA22AF|nr:DUF4139 domain-containing protein [Streptacidiphilus sp. PB12-B1b]QMU79170.1 DUF4139 domain-containing protein [Streptacidiphilus sp. PB12-B1b]
MDATTAAPTAAPTEGPLPVTAVTLLEDRAEVERQALLDLAPGIHRLRLGPITPLAVDHSLRAEFVPAPPADRPDTADAAAGAVDAAPTVVDARIVRRYTPPPTGEPGPEDSALQHRIHELTGQVRTAEAEERRAAGRLGVLEQLLGELLRDVAETAGADEGEPDRWSAELDRAYAAHTGQAEALRQTGRRLSRLRTELSRAEAAREAAEERPPVLSAFVDLVVRVPAASPAARLRLRHLVPCALWRPAYRATLAVDGSALELECEAVVWQRTGEDWPQVGLALSTARSAQAAEPPAFVEDALSLVDRTPEERRTVEVDIREVEIQSVGPAEGAEPAFSPAMSPDAGPGPLALPGVDDGGETRLLAAPTPVSVAGDGRPHRVRLTAATLPARTEYLSAPELSPLVTLVARFRNGTGQPLLSGPVDLVRGSGFVGRGDLRFTAPGAEAELSFGSEDSFRVTRSVQESRDTSGLSGRTVIARTVLLNVSRFAPPGAPPVTVTVRERIPVSEISAVEVRLAKEGCEPPPESADADGLLRYELRLAPDERRVLTLAYEISAARSVAL